MFFPVYLFLVLIANQLKVKMLPFPTSARRTLSCFEIIQNDVQGMSPICSYPHYKYFVTLILTLFLFFIFKTRLDCSILHTFRCVCFLQICFLSGIVPFIRVLYVMILLINVFAFPNFFIVNLCFIVFLLLQMIFLFFPHFLHYPHLQNIPNLA